MTSPRSSILRSALQISSERIAAMTDEELNRLMGQLLRAQAYRCKSPLNEIRTNTEIKAPDDGCDGWSARPGVTDEWLGSSNTCWQFKAGVAGEPSRLKGEVNKRIPTETLAAGGRFVVVASGSTNGPKGEDDRRRILIEEGTEARLPTNLITVIGSEGLTNWVNQHPAIAASWAGLPEGLCTLADWAKDEEHQVPWQASSSVQNEIEDLRTKLEFGSGSILHFHIRGLPGVGKTRFALELCKGASWSNSVVYVNQTSDFPMTELISGVNSDDHSQIIIVADEVQVEQLLSLRELVGRGMV